MKAIILLSLLAVPGLCLGGCDDVARPAPAPAPPASAPVPAPAAPAGATIAELEARLTALKAEAAQAGIDAKRAAADLAAAKRQAWLDAQEARLYWFAGILGLLALGGAVVAFFQPQIAHWAARFSIACGAVAAIAVFAVQVLPYLWWIGGGLVTVGVLAYLWWNRLSDKTKAQVITAVEQNKAAIPDYKTKFAAVIDSDADRMVDWTRKHLGVR